MILNGESVTVLVTVTSLGAEVDKPRELVDPRFIERSDIGVYPFISPVGHVLPRRSVSQVARPVVSSTPVSVINVHAWIGFATLLAVFHDVFVEVYVVFTDIREELVPFFRIPGSDVTAVMIYIPVSLDDVTLVLSIDQNVTGRPNSRPWPFVVHPHQENV